jgi:hypothetical protein
VAQRNPPIDGVPPVSAARIRIAVLVVLAGLTPAGAVAAAPQAVATITLLTPGNGTLVEGAPVFRWRVDQAQPAAGTVTVTHRLGTDVALTQNVATTSRTCPAQDLGCWTSATPGRSYRGPHYWRVAVTGAVTATSRTWMFQGVAPRLAPDRERPHVRAYAGSATRGRKALFVARVADNRGEARLRVDLLYRNQLVFRAMTLLKRVRWGVRQRFDSRAPLARSLYPGAYRLCVTAWDRTGNQARDCARYLIR